MIPIPPIYDEYGIDVSEVAHRVVHQGYRPPIHISRKLEKSKRW